MSIHVSSLIRGFCLVSIVAIALNGLADGIPGAWAAMLWLGVIFFFSSRRMIEAQPLIVLISVATCLYFGLRLWDYYVLDVREIISFQPSAQMVLSGTATPALVFGALVMVAVYTGLLLATVRWNQPHPPKFQPYYPDINGDLFFILVTGMLVVQGALSYSQSDFIGNASLAVKLLSVATSHESLLPVAAMIYARSVKMKPRAQIFLLICLIVVVRMVGGSRSAPVDIAEILLAWAIIPGNWDHTVKISAKALLLLCLLVFGSLAGFVIATLVRISQYGISGTDVVRLDSWADFGNLALLTYRQVSYRVGTNLDTLLFVFSNYYDRAYADAHLNFNTLWQTVLRRTLSVPMDPNFTFEEFELGVLVGNRGSWVNGELFPTSYSWGLFAYFFQLMHYWALPALLAIFFGIGRFFRWLSEKAPTIGRDFLLFWTAHAMELTIPLFGISNLFSRGRGAIVPFLTIMLLLSLFAGSRNAKSAAPVSETAG